MSWWTEKENTSLINKHYHESISETLYRSFRKINGYSDIFFGASLGLFYIQKGIFSGVVVFIFAFLTLIECAFILKDLGKRKGLRLINAPFFIGSFILTILACIHANLFFDGGNSVVHASVIGAIISLITCSLFLFKMKDMYNAISDISYTIFVLTYISMSIAITIIMSGDLIIGTKKIFAGIDGFKFLLYIFIVSKCADIGRIIGGKAFGSKGITSGFDNSHSLEAYFAGSLLGMSVSVGCYSYVKIGDVHFAWIAILLGIGISLLAFMGDAIIEMLAQDARINAKSSSPLSPIANMGMLQRIGFLSINIPIAYATLHVIETYV